MLDVTGPRMYTDYGHVSRWNVVHYPVLQSSVKAGSAPWDLVDPYATRKHKWLHFFPLTAPAETLVLSLREIFSSKKVLVGAWTLEKLGSISLLQAGDWFAAQSRRGVAMTVMHIAYRSISVCIFSQTDILAV